jgi:hypothetical protein
MRTTVSSFATAVSVARGGLVPAASVGAGGDEIKHLFERVVDSVREPC